MPCRCQGEEFNTSLSSPNQKLIGICYQLFGFKTDAVTMSIGAILSNIIVSARHHTCQKFGYKDTRFRGPFNPIILSNWPWNTRHSWKQSLTPHNQIIIIHTWTRGGSMWVHPPVCFVSMFTFLGIVYSLEDGSRRGGDLKCRYIPTSRTFSLS